MKKIILISACVSLFVSCQRNDDNIPVTQEQGPVLRQKSVLTSVPTGSPMTTKDIDAEIEKAMNERNNFNWTDASLPMIWSALQYYDNVVAIGYRPLNVKNDDNSIYASDIRNGQWKNVHDALISFILEELNRYSKNKVTLADILVEDDASLPILTLKLSDRNVITSLYNIENVRYLEPISYWPVNGTFKMMSSSGCNASTTPINAADYTTIPPGCRLPWNYNNLNIPAAWNIAQGEGIKIGIIDAGISSSQSLLGSMFNNGYSNNTRTVSVDYTYGTSAYTSCTHGTSMSGLAVGPRNDQNAVTGVAYKSSLYFIHGCEDVILDAGAEKTGVKNALKKLGDDINTKIISMSVGSPFASSVLLDGVKYAHTRNKMIFAAAGTSFSWTSWWGVVYPAAYSQCIAVTGVKENGATCNSCHDGSQVKFTVPMERNASTNRNSLSLPLSNIAPTYIGGSSAATATAAGIAALVWSVNPLLTRDQVYNCMKNTAQFYPSVNSTKGYGNLNAAAAVTMAGTL